MNGQTLTCLPCCARRLLSIARGEQQTFAGSSMATAAEACKSNALMRCCKDLGIAGELWCVCSRLRAPSCLVRGTDRGGYMHRDPQFIRKFKADYCVEAWVTHVTTGKKCVYSRPRVVSRFVADSRSGCRAKRWRKKDAKFDYPYNG